MCGRQIREVTKTLTKRKQQRTIDENLVKKTKVFRIAVLNTRSGKGRRAQPRISRMARIGIETAKLTSQVRHDSGAQSERIAGAMCGRQIREMTQSEARWKQWRSIV